MRLRIWLCLIAVVCAAHAQWLEARVSDSMLGTLSSPEAMVYDSAGNKVFIACSGGSSVLVVDCSTNQKVAKIPLPANSGSLNFMSYNPVNRKVYVSCQNTGTLAVIDAASNTLINRIQLGTYTWDVCYNSVRNKVYCISLSESNLIVTVLDGATDSVLKTIFDAHPNGTLCYNPTDDKIYVPRYSPYGVAVIDGATDSVTANINTPTMPLFLLLQLREQQVLLVLPRLLPVRD